MDKLHSLCTPTVIRLLDVDKSFFRLLENDEELLDTEVSYLSAIEELMFLTNYTRSSITFAINLLNNI